MHWFAEKGFYHIWRKSCLINQGSYYHVNLFPFLSTPPAISDVFAGTHSKLIPRTVANLS